jgi:hypothetical protein
MTTDATRRRHPRGRLLIASVLLAAGPAPAAGKKPPDTHPSPHVPGYAVD